MKKWEGCISKKQFRLFVQSNLGLAETNVAGSVYPMERFVWISKSVGQTHDFATRLIQVFCFHTQSPRKQRMQEAVRWLTSKLLIANRFST
ncbi:MAG TPA: hypothetical protein DEF45_10130 [Rhodopirellula sp.]|nr:hypothetical protein [Rhodopirellula sp.]